MSGVNSIPMPGRGGPCGVRCEHENCAAVREIVFSICRLCRKTIGFMKEYRRDASGFIHDACLKMALEQRKKLSEAAFGNHSTNVSPTKSPEPSGEQSPGGGHNKED